MSGVYDVLQPYEAFDFDAFWATVTLAEVDAVLAKERLQPADYLKLLAPVAAERLEAMARRAQAETRKHFGRTIQLFTPLYVSDYCINGCVYCGFRHNNDFSRRQLTMAEVDAEARAISRTGLKHVLFLTGEHPGKSTVAYMLDCVEVLKRHFSSISVEVYSLTEDEYRALAAAGVDGMTMYQEVYQRELYGPLHPWGPKSDYLYRLNAPERACRGGMRAVTVGALLGLEPWRREAFYTGLHAYYLQQQYPGTQIQIAPPRLRPCLGGFPPADVVDDRDLVQYITAYRIFMPHSGICVSTRERQGLRDELVQLGVTKMSAGVSTAVGGHSHPEQEEQFEPADGRSVAEMAAMLKTKGYQPLFQDWHYQL